MSLFCCRCCCYISRELQWIIDMIRCQCENIQFASSMPLPLIALHWNAYFVQSYWTYSKVISNVLLRRCIFSIIIDLILLSCRQLEVPSHLSNGNSTLLWRRTLYFLWSFWSKRQIQWLVTIQPTYCLVFLCHWFKLFWLESSSFKQKIVLNTCDVNRFLLQYSILVVFCKSRRIDFSSSLDANSAYKTNQVSIWNMSLFAMSNLHM